MITFALVSKYGLYGLAILLVLWGGYGLYRSGRAGRGRWHIVFTLVFAVCLIIVGIASFGNFAKNKFDLAVQENVSNALISSGFVSGNGTNTLADVSGTPLVETPVEVSDFSDANVSTSTVESNALSAQAIVAEWQVKPFDQWTLLDAQEARVVEWKKLKGDATKLVMEEQLGVEAPAVTAQGTYVVFTGHGDFTFATAKANWAYEKGTLYILVLRNETAEPLQFHGANFPTGGTSVIEYVEEKLPSIQALAGLPLHQVAHCGVDCQKVVVKYVRHTAEGEIVKDYEFSRQAIQVGNTEPITTTQGSQQKETIEVSPTPLPTVGSVSANAIELCGAEITENWETSNPKYLARVGSQLVITSDPVTIEGNKSYSTRVVIISENTVQLVGVQMGNEGHANSYGCSVPGIVSAARIASLKASMEGSEIVDLRPADKR